MNIAHLRVRFARQASERDSQLGATTNPHAATAVAIDLYVLRQREPDHHRIGVAIGSTAHVLFIRVELPVPNGTFETVIGQYACPKSVSSAFAYPPWRIAAILQGG